MKKKTQNQHSLQAELLCLQTLTVSSPLYLEPQHKWCVTTGSDHGDSVPSAFTRQVTLGNRRASTSLQQPTHQKEISEGV